MRAERAGVASLAALGAAACCGLPVLLSVSAGITVAGLGLRSWVLVGAGLVAAGAGAWRLRHRGREPRRAAARARD
jgi:hypothetical protein